MDSSPRDGDHQDQEQEQEDLEDGPTSVSRDSPTSVYGGEGGGVAAGMGLNGAKNHRHNKTVSWDLGAVAFETTRKTSPPSSPTRSPLVESVESVTSLLSEMGGNDGGGGGAGSQRRLFGVRDVLDHNPVEDAAESLLQATLDEERSVASRRSVKEAQSTILPTIPDGIKTVLLERQDTKTTSRFTDVSPAAAATTPTAPPLSHRRCSSTYVSADVLNALTAQMRGMQEEAAKAASVSPRPPPPPKRDGDRPAPVSQADILAQNAVTLVKRNHRPDNKDKKISNNKNPSGGGGDPLGNSLSSGRSGHNSNTNRDGIGVDSSDPVARRWEMLKLAVTGSSHRWKDLKKTDDHEEVVSVNGMDATDLELGVDVGGVGGARTDGPSIHTTKEELIKESKENRNSIDSSDSNGKHLTRRKKMLDHGNALSIFRDFREWVRFRRPGLLGFARTALLYFILPGMSIAALLFYAFGNPPCGTASQCTTIERITPDDGSNKSGSNPVNSGSNETSSNTIVLVTEVFHGASVSWWLLFVTVRQVITCAAAVWMDAWIIDFVCLRTRWARLVLGAFGTLFVVQSKGWPFILFIWAVLDFALLYGNHAFAHHWLFWQDAIGLFNASNPSGTVTSSQLYTRALALSMGVSAAVAIKRFWVGLWLGKQTYIRYAQDLADLMKRALSVGEVANLARKIETQGLLLSDFGLDRDAWQLMEDAEELQDKEAEISDPSSLTGRASHHRRNSSQSRLTDESGSVSGRRRFSTVAQVMTLKDNAAKIDQLLNAWEEPKTIDGEIDRVDVASIIQFRQSLSYLNSAFPFGVAFGTADSRAECVAAVEDIYHRLLLSNPGKSCLTFDVFAFIAIRRDGSLDEGKLGELVNVFRPDRSGNLSLLDFAKSVDSVYKDLRLLRASIVTSSRMDRAFEGVINIAFYTVVFFVIIAALEVNPLVLFASISGFVLSFTFMFGTACSKYFEGVLFILVRRPYEIGDRINISPVEQDTDAGGSAGWIVFDVNLHTTTCIFGTTNEVCTYSNGSLANSRIINAARSPQAVLSFLLKVPIDVSFKKLTLYRKAIEKFLNCRPREWVSLVAFRPTRVEVDLGFIEYTVMAKHRDSWQQIGAVLDSKADFISFGLELQKKMGMRYQSPPLPIEFLQTRTTRRRNPDGDTATDEDITADVARLAELTTLVADESGDDDETSHSLSLFARMFGRMA